MNNKLLNRNSSPVFITYLGLLLFITSLLVFQSRYPVQLNELFFIILAMTVVSATELINIKFGIITFFYTILLWIFLSLFNERFYPVHISLIEYSLIFLSFYYLLIKIIRRKKLERTTERERYFRSLVNFSLQPLILKNEKGEVIFASETIKGILELKKNIIIGSNLENYLHPEDISRHKLFLADVVNNPLEKKSIELRMKKGDSNWIWVRNDSINLLKQKDIKAIVSSIQDITFQKQLDREKAEIIMQEKKARNLAENAVRERDEFLSIASHELKTPLTTILLQLQATLRRILVQTLADFSGKELLTSLQIAEKQSQRLGSLIKDLLNASVASTGKLSLNKEKVELTSLVESLISRYSEEINLSGSQIKLKKAGYELFGNWDPIRIEQAVSNILMNALKYSNGSDIMITIKKEDNFGSVSIKDKGKGIDPNFQKVIFEPFKRVNGDNTGGLGVGLFIANHIAISHGGAIELESDPGKGSTFTLKLPLLETQKN